MKAVKLKTEYLKNPLGIDIKNPRFMWNCEGGKAQSAYRLIASDTRGNITVSYTHLTLPTKLEV